MNHKSQLIVAVTAVAVIVVALAVLLLLRTKDANEFSQNYRVRTPAGTNYIVQLTQAMVGRVDSGCVVIVYARLQNPNPFELALDRNIFVLADYDRNYYLPTIEGTQARTIRIPANGMIDQETLSYIVPDDSFAGRLGLKIGYNYFVEVKNSKPFRRKLLKGYFLSFHTKDW